MSEFDVRERRNEFIGGSDIPIIMGLSTFKTRFDLLQEKAGMKVDDFKGNKFTSFGNELEPKIRDYINTCGKYTRFPFVPEQFIEGDFRGHTDGFNQNAVLEIKTTSHIYNTVDEYKVYLVQLLKYIEVTKVDHGILAVYERPEDMDTNFDSERLHVYRVVKADYEGLLKEINYELDRFREDLEKLKANPLLTEQDFQPNELVILSQEVVKFEEKLAEMKAIEAQCKKAKQALYEAMESHGVKSWTTPNGTKVTMVAATPESVETVEEFDLETFKAENEGLYGMYLHEVEKKKSGRAGFVKITIPKG